MITSAFSHQDVFHLGANTWVLTYFGEGLAGARVGAIRMAVPVLGSAVPASAAQAYYLGWLPKKQRKRGWSGWIAGLVLRRITRYTFCWE